MKIKNMKLNHKIFIKIWKRGIKPFKRFIGNILKKNEQQPCVIMRIDGGFSSQILRYSKGMWFKEHGMKVKYDLQWYVKNGMDDFGIEPREWRLSHCFPNLELEVASDREINKYRWFYGTDIHNMVERYKGKEEELKVPLYVAEYDFDYLVPNVQPYVKYFDWEGLYNLLSDSAKKIADDIELYKKKGKEVIGVHVRRGDMAVTRQYWKALTPRYFEVAINKVAADDSILYFFSNGFDFVKGEILPLIHNEYVLVDDKNEDYEDIYLYSLCSVQVASQGSWGGMAFCFNNNKDRKLVIPSADIEENQDEGEVIKIKLEDDMYYHN